MLLNTEYIDNINKRLEGINDTLDVLSEQYATASAEQIAQFKLEITAVLEEQLTNVRNDIVNILKPTVKPIAEKIAVLEPIIGLMEDIMTLSLADLGAVITAITNIRQLLQDIVLYTLTGGYNEIVELYADVIVKIATLSNNIAELSNHTFPNPEIGSISVTIPTITIDELLE